MRRIQDKLGEIKAPDGINEQLWRDIMIPEFNSISIEYAHELQKEGLIKFVKPWGEQDLDKAPPTRILSLVLPMVAWLGWVMHKKGGETGTWKQIEEAFTEGVNLSLTNQFS